MRFLSAVLMSLPVYLFCTVSNVQAATYYIGSFQNSNPTDSSNCGTRERPCASLHYFNQFRRSGLNPGDRVRLAPGRYAASSAFNCIIIDRHADGVSYEGRTADDQAARDMNAVQIDLANTSGVPCGGGGNY